MCFYQAHFGRTVLPKWPFWAHLFYSVFYSVSELRRACFRQARVARAVLPPGALFRAGAFALPPCAPKSHMRPLPHLGVSYESQRCSASELPHLHGNPLLLSMKSGTQPPPPPLGLPIPLLRPPNTKTNPIRPRPASNPPKFAQPGLSRSTGWPSPTRRVQSGVRLLLYGLSLPRCDVANLGVFDLCFRPTQMGLCYFGSMCI